MADEEDKVEFDLAAEARSLSGISADSSVYSPLPLPLLVPYLEPRVDPIEQRGPGDQNLRLFAVRGLEVPEVPKLDLLLDDFKPTHDLLRFRRQNDPLSGKHLDVGDAAGDVVPVQSSVHSNRGSKVLYGMRRWGLDPPCP